MNEVKTWQTRCEDRRYTGVALTSSVVRDAMRDEIDELRALYAFATKNHSEWVARMNTQLESALAERDELLAKLKALRELSDAEIQAVIDSVHMYTGDYANAVARAVLAAAGSKT